MEPQVATDVAARGLDVPDVKAVVCWDCVSVSRVSVGACVWAECGHRGGQQAGFALPNLVISPQP